MRVVALCSQKGGSGKTTLSGHLAVQAELAGAGPVALIDTDPQGSLAAWWNERQSEAPAFVSTSLAQLPADIERLRLEGCSLVLIDTPPQIDTDARRAIRGADLVVVPVQPSPPDIWAAEGTLKLAADERRPACLVLNRVAVGSRLRGTSDAELRARGMAVLPAGLGNRAAFSHAFAEGLGVTEAEPRSQAAAEVWALLAVLEGIVGEER